MVAPGRGMSGSSPGTAAVEVSRAGGVRREGSRPMKRLLGALALGGLVALAAAVPSASAQYAGTPGYGYPTAGYGYPSAGYGYPTYTAYGVPTYGGVYGSYPGSYSGYGYGPLPSSYGYLGGYGSPSFGLGGLYGYAGGYPYYGTGGYPYLGAYGGYPNTIGYYGGYPLYGGYGSPAAVGVPYGSYTASYAGSYGGLSPVAPLGTYSSVAPPMGCTGMGYPC